MEYVWGITLVTRVCGFVKTSTEHKPQRWTAQSHKDGTAERETAYLLERRRVENDLQFYGFGLLCSNLRVP